MDGGKSPPPTPYSSPTNKILKICEKEFAFIFIRDKINHSKFALVLWSKF
jgi:hypothetical protein